MIDFVGKRKLFFTIPTIIIMAGIIGLIVNGGLNYDIQFQGGTILKLKCLMILLMQMKLAQLLAKL